MPEGHALHRVARACRPLVGRGVRTSSPQGRFVDGARRLDRRVVQDVQAYGKHLLVAFDDVDLHVHLGLRGSVFDAAPGSIARRSNVARSARKSAHGRHG